MNKFKVQLSKFDIGMIIAFVVVGLLGAVAWWVLSGQLQSAQAACAQVAGDYNSYATSKGIIVSPANAKALGANSTLLQAQLDPVISSYLLAKGNDLANVRGEDPVAWKHDLDDDVRTLATEAKAQGIGLPEHFYFGFTRYVTESPGDAATEVLTKQRKAIKTIMEILINAPVKSIGKVRRTYEEDPHSATSSANLGEQRTEGDQIGGYAVVPPDSTYTAYPFEIEFDASPEALRPILDGLIKSPYLFVLRTIEVHNEQLDSPKVDSLAQMAGGSGTPSVISSEPGAVAASTPTVGPQYLFGYAPLHVKMRVDMIEWSAALSNVDALAAIPTTTKPAPNTKKVP
ncbi:MAG TPA: Amuc_1100 family pilus-like protein [Candidatus Methylacidiphilales bacterium]|jgi:hypothetical protein|nr:Amuc_1100 family pilus-like protein [Candidatus Methylacidiphilales bacterium]